MKKVFIWILLLVFANIAYLVFANRNYYPLEMHDFKKLFSGNIKRANKIYSQDFIGFSIHGELYDINIYELIGNPLINDTTIILNWDYDTIDKSSIVNPWKKCPVDSESISENWYIMSHNISNKSFSKKFFQEINNNNNYFKYIINSNGHRFFFLYIINEKLLYYIRYEGA